MKDKAHLWYDKGKILFWKYSWSYQNTIVFDVAVFTSIDKQWFFAATKILAKEFSLFLLNANTVFALAIHKAFEMIVLTISSVN